MTHAFNLSKPKIIFTSPFAAEKATHVAQSLNFVQKLVLFDTENPFGSAVTLFNDFLSRAAPSPFSPMPVNKSNAVSIILCSSGTTGLPKVRL